MARNYSSTSLFKIEEKQLPIPRRGIEGEFTSQGWPRGIAWLSDRRVLIGSTPASLYEIDVQQMEIANKMRLEEDVFWTVADIYTDPRMARQEEG